MGRKLTAWVAVGGMVFGFSGAVRAEEVAAVGQNAGVIQDVMTLEEGEAAQAKEDSGAQHVQQMAAILAAQGQQNNGQSAGRAAYIPPMVDDEGNPLEWGDYTPVENPNYHPVFTHEESSFLVDDEGNPIVRPPPVTNGGGDIYDGPNEHSHYGDKYPHDGSGGLQIPVVEEIVLDTPPPPVGGGSGTPPPVEEEGIFGDFLWAIEELIGSIGGLFGN